MTAGLGSSKRTNGILNSTGNGSDTRHFGHLRQAQCYAIDADHPVGRREAGVLDGMEHRA
jgi:hypothetical protein